MNGSDRLPYSLRILLESVIRNRHEGCGEDFRPGEYCHQASRDPIQACTCSPSGLSLSPFPHGL